MICASSQEKVATDDHRTEQEDQENRQHRCDALKTSADSLTEAWAAEKEERGGRKSRLKVRGLKKQCAEARWRTGHAPHSMCLLIQRTGILRYVGASTHQLVWGVQGRTNHVHSEGMAVRQMLHRQPP